MLTLIAIALVYVMARETASDLTALLLLAGGVAILICAAINAGDAAILNRLGYMAAALCYIIGIPYVAAAVLPHYAAAPPPLAWMLPPLYLAVIPLSLLILPFVLRPVVRQYGWRWYQWGRRKVR